MNQQNMGKSLIRAKKKRQLANRQNFQAILEQEQRQHVSQETAPKLKSVWQTSNLDDVLAAADQRLEGYTANRDVRVVVSGAVHVVTGDKLRPETELATKDWHLLSAKLPIPERPRWNFRMSATDVEIQEKASFVEWRRELARIEEADKVLMTPYEKNVEVWRQLWRVVERSDIVLEIVDARNPLAFRSEGLERYVAKHNTKAGKPKQCVLLLNKADLLTETQRKHWAEYFKAQNVKFYFFSARASTEAAAAAAKGEININPAETLESQLEDAELEREAEKDGDDESDGDEDTEQQLQQRHRGGASQLEEEKYEAAAMKQLRDEAKGTDKKERRRKDRRTAGAPTVVVNPYAVPQLKEAAEKRRLEKEAEAKKEKPLTAQEIERDRRLAQLIQDRVKPWDVLDPTTLLDALAVLRSELGVVGSESIMVGMTGYPNVGKSSTINAIMACKKVVVSATPGKTKHFQTLPIPNERRLILCDCPGLVFPSFSSTKEAMVCDGILPVDTCRDYVAAVGLLCRRIPRPVLEKQYLVVLEKEYDVDESNSHPELVLNMLARRKGYMTEHDKPNRYRSAHILLKEYVDGKLLYVHPPPGLVLVDPNPPTAAPGASKSKAPKDAKPAAAAAAAAEEEVVEDDGDDEGWETDDGDDENWEDVSDAEDARQLSDDGSSAASEDEEPDPLSFWAITNYTVPRPLLTAELFNLEHNTAVATHEEKVFKRYKKKVNHMLVPDEGPGSYRVNSKGQKELIIDDDDDIEICDEIEVKEKKPSKRTQRRQAKQGVLALKGAKPAAPHSLYSLSAEAQGTH